MKARHALLASIAAGAVALVSAKTAVRSAPEPAAGGAITGTWTAEPATWKPAAGNGPFVQLSLSRRQGRGHSQHSSTVALSELKGLTAAQMNAGSSSASFTLDRDAGRVSFEGSFRGGEGAGHFTFTPSADYVAAMGYALDDEKLYSMAVLDVSREFVRQLDALGYSRLDLDQLVSLRIHGADPAFIRELKALGYDHPTVDDLVSLRIHGATPEFVRDLQSLGYRRLSAQDLVSLRIHGAAPDFVRQLRELGYDRLSAEDLVSMRIHGVSPEFVRRVQASRGSVSIERLVSMRIHGEER